MPGKLWNRLSLSFRRGDPLLAKVFEGGTAGVRANIIHAGGRRDAGRGQGGTNSTAAIATDFEPVRRRGGALSRRCDIAVSWHARRIRRPHAADAMQTSIDRSNE